MASYFGLWDTIPVGVLFFLKQSKFRLQDKYTPSVGVARRISGWALLWYLQISVSHSFNEIRWLG
jgi:hypothetical protein